MQRTRLVWLLCLPIAAVGGLVAHLAVYSAVAPGSGHAAHHAHAQVTAHAGGLHLRACLAICGAVFVVGVAAAGMNALRRGRPIRMPVWTFALLPPVVFALQEQFEALAVGAPFAEPAFALGLALQLPFAVVAYLVARVVLSAVRALVRCGGLPRPRLLLTELSWRPAAPRALALEPVLAHGHGQRAPPLLA